jgi:hypothetical protein
MIHNLHNLIGWKSETVLMRDGREVLKPPAPHPSTYRSRLKAIWAVWMGRAYVVRWPQPGDLEETLHTHQIVPREPRLKVVASR